MEKTGVAAGIALAAAGLFLLTRKARADVHLGDLDGDGELTYTDLQTLAYYLAAGYDYLHYLIRERLSEKEFLRRADVNRDGVVDEADMVALYELISGKPPEKPEPIQRRSVCMYGKVYSFPQPKVPLPGAYIRITYPVKEMTISDSNGNYELCFQVELEDDHFELEVSAGGHETASGWGYLPDTNRFKNDLGLERL